MDFAGSDRNLLTQLSLDAQTSARKALGGIAAIGSLLAHAGPEIEDGTVSADAVEALGLLLAELGQLALTLQTLSANCQRVAMAPGER